MIVIDSSYALACVMPDEVRPSSMQAVLDEPLLAPALWPLELANATRSAVRRRRIGMDQARAICMRLIDFEVEMVKPWHDEPLRYLDFAVTHALTPYDGVYLDLAITRRIAIATRDSALIAAAQRLGVRVYN